MEVNFGHLKVLHSKFHDPTISNLGDQSKQTDKQTDKRTDKQKDKQKNRENYKQTNKQTNRQLVSELETPKLI